LKNFDEEGFVFYTNYNSEKIARQLIKSPILPIVFFVERQVIIKGIAKKQRKKLGSLFDSRPDGSKLGAIVSNQSEIILL
jgi:pyridoxamine 5'-phosphate oxidase